MLLRAILFATLALAITPLRAQSIPWLTNARHDPNVPTYESVIGRPLGDDVSTFAEAERYLQVLADASDRVDLQRYGTSWEGRTLYCVVVTAPSNHARLAEVQAGMRQLADPRPLDDNRANELLRTLPAVGWLVYNVHGDEPSGTDAALAIAYHLAAARDDALVDAILRESVALLDPMQNPDGRDRFVSSFRSMRGRVADAEPDAAEHHQPWPGGRSNHYWFDMNRDWFGLTQPETRARVRLFQQWWPLVVADLHEMGSNSTYYFAPPAHPINPEVTLPQRQWLERYGKNNAAWFDRFGISYFVREDYDCFYPGYGEGWPLFQGTIGMTYEQGSVRGQRVRREDDIEVHYRDCTRNHFLASLSTLETLARNRESALRTFYEYRRSAVREGETGPIREFVFPTGRDPGRTRKLMALLAAQGIEVRQAREELRNGRAREFTARSEVVHTFPAGTFVVPMAPPNKRLAYVLLVQNQDMSESFLQDQLKKYARREDTDFYDLTGWSLPLLWDVECYVASDMSLGRTERVEVEQLNAPQRPALAPAKVAYLVPWGTHAAAAAGTALLSADLRVHCAGKRFVQAGRSYPAGTLVVRVAEHADAAALHARVAAIAARTDAEIVPTDSGWVDEGISLGSREVRLLRRPKVLIACDRPVDANSAGWMRYLLEQNYGMDVTMVRTRQLGRARLSRFTTLVLPDGTDYATEIGKAGAERIKEWIDQGGTLITCADATQWLTEKDVGLLASEREMRNKPTGDKPAENNFDYARAILPERELPGATPGAILRVLLDAEHWLGFGYDGGANVVVGSRNVFTPVKLDRGVNVAVYETRQNLLRSGFSWDDKLDQLAQKAYLVHQPHARGHVVAFAEDPNVRGLARGLELLVLNAILFGTAY